MSSLDAIDVSPLTALPVYTASRVSKLLPSVSIVAVPLAAAVNRYQIERPPGKPAWFGSPDSFVAATYAAAGE